MKLEIFYEIRAIIAVTQQMTQNFLIVVVLFCFFVIFLGNLGECVYISKLSTRKIANLKNKNKKRLTQYRQSGHCYVHTLFLFHKWHRIRIEEMTLLISLWKNHKDVVKLIFKMLFDRLEIIGKKKQFTISLLLNVIRLASQVYLAFFIYQN